MTTYAVTVKAVDMPEDMRHMAVSATLEALRSGHLEKEMAGVVKKEFDKRYGPSWHCVVGKNFGSFVTHEKERFIYMFVDRCAVLLFKSA